MKSTSTPSSSPAKRGSRREAQRRSRQRARTLRWAAAGGLLAVAAIAIFLIASNNPAGAGGDIEGLQTYPNLSRDHSSEPVAYDLKPPAGGVHNPAWLNCGVYTEPVADENAVHSLEHGAVWITYLPDLAAAEVGKLEDITRQSAYRLLSPYPGQPAPIILTAWGYQLALEQADDPRLMAFIGAYEQNPNGPEPGASCTGGVGQPG